ncbi:uncharacterized protein C19orf47 homolog isoform X2 [Austrofundulus limnaeus]|uniref:Uncharacterized protein C19orf47 homolog isoform X2 n=1 Tax=Austrofundulus limnaeus TaxID=52670 RepID=A0A2I4CE94_AUSLI|nr:PREDICTED: uncharacterized protein C19orf47 homolog isoform X2 [Austrofundulus limnaeus]
MATVTTATSEWIQFFKDAGIPAGLAVNYAVSFVDNRIQKNMLMDLSKDIMMDLGITVVGDIIAILKHAKQVYRQDMCKMATEAISSGQTSVQAELRRTANTPATRMIANALSHDSPPTTPARRPDNRLSVTVSNSQANKNNKAVVSQPADEGNGLPAVKRRRVTAEMEGLKRTSVFERLGAESMADTTTSNNKPTGVFSRLDRADEGEDAPKPGNVAVIVDEDEEESDGEGSVLQYAGILKRPPPQPKKKPTTKAAPVSLRRLGGKFKRPPSDSPTSSSASSPKVPPAKVSILQRLGKLPAASAGVSAAPADTQDNKVTSTKPRAPEKSTVASCKVSSSTGTGGAGGAEPVGAKMDVKAVSVFKRLGSKQP